MNSKPTKPAHKLLQAVERSLAAQRQLEHAYRALLAGGRRRLLTKKVNPK
jgi:hypothetical protein